MAEERIYIDVRDKKLNCIKSIVVSKEQFLLRVSRGIYFQACGTMKDWSRCKKIYIPFAEAALNAILSSGE